MSQNIWLMFVLSCLHPFSITALLPNSQEDVLKFSGRVSSGMKSDKVRRSYDNGRSPHVKLLKGKPWYITIHDDCALHHYQDGRRRSHLWNEKEKNVSIDLKESNSDLNEQKVFNVKSSDSFYALSALSFNDKRYKRNLISSKSSNNNDGVHHHHHFKLSEQTDNLNHDTDDDEEYDEDGNDDDTPPTSSSRSPHLNQNLIKPIDNQQIIVNHGNSSLTGSTILNESHLNNYEHHVQQWAESLLKNGSINIKNDFGNKRKSRGSRSVCKISEFSCTRGKCIPSSKYCDGISDCGPDDISDEPPSCSRCNRTYYGEWGTTYSLSLTSEMVMKALNFNNFRKHKYFSRSSYDTGSQYQSEKKEKRKFSGPQFVCQLTFAAAGGAFGDLVEIIMDSFSVGRITSTTEKGCPEGSLQVAELNRPVSGGKWCGSGGGTSVYYSEMSAISLTLTFGPLEQGQSSVSQYNPSGLDRSNRPIPPAEIHKPFSGEASTGSQSSLYPRIPGLSQQPIDFSFKIRYKFVPRSMATVRYGVPENPLERGKLIPGTYCGRVLERCHRRRCKIQSPNYPGLYSRNLTCMYHVKHREKPPCKRVLIQVAQPKPHKVQLRSVSGKGTTSVFSANDPTTQVDTFQAWEDCTGDKDMIIVYDGTTTNDPVLLKICGGAYIPPVTSSGPQILVAFHSTPYGNPLEPKPAAPFPVPSRGFELDVDIITVDSEKADYGNNHTCSFFFVSSKPGGKAGSAYRAQEYGGNWIAGVRGRISNPRHTVSPNSTCRYEFLGRKHENIWIYFVSYRREIIKDSKLYDGNCTTKLTISDGLDSQHEVLLESLCDNDLPRLCPHKALENETRIVRACAKEESYVSAGSRLIIEQQYPEGSALRPLHYKLHYEFVNRHYGTSGKCDRKFYSSKMKSRGKIRTSDNVFDFGRGGRQNVTCTYTFYLNAYESLHLTLRNSSFGNRACRTVRDYDTGRYSCDYDSVLNSTNSRANSMDGKKQMNRKLMNSILNESLSSYDTSLTWKPSISEEKVVSPSFLSPSVVQSGKSQLTLTELIWSNVNLGSHNHCICGNNSDMSFIFLGREVQLTFMVENMGGDDSYDNFYALFDYEIRKGEGCRGDNHYMKSGSGLISLESTYIHGIHERPPACERYPYLVEAQENHSLYLRIQGFAMLEEKAVHAGPFSSRPKNETENGESRVKGASRKSRTIENDAKGDAISINSSSHSNDIVVNDENAKVNEKIGNPTTASSKNTIKVDRDCPTTRNRIFIYDGKNRLVQKICPASKHQLNKKTAPFVEIYSEDFSSYSSPLYKNPNSRFKIEFIGRELGSYRIEWLEVMPAKRKTVLRALQKQNQLYSNHGTKKKFNLPISPVNFSQFDIFNGESMLEGETPGDSVHLIGMSPEEKSRQIAEQICPYYCSELESCIDKKLWCDGRIHCPVTGADEKSCDTFLSFVRQLMTAAVYVPVAAAFASFFSCSCLVLTCVALRKSWVKSRMKDHDPYDIGPGNSRVGSAYASACSTVDRRLPPKDYFMDPHDPIS